VKFEPCPHCSCPWAWIPPQLQLVACPSPLCTRYNEPLVDVLSVVQFRALMRWMRAKLLERNI